MGISIFLKSFHQSRVFIEEKKRMVVAKGWREGVANRRA